MTGRGALLKELTGGAAISLGVKIGGVLLTFVSFLALARVMDPVAYGVFASGFSLATMMSYVAVVGQHVAILRFWPAMDEAHGRAAAAQTIRYGAGLAVLGGGAVGLLVGLFAAGGGRVGAFGETRVVYVWIGALVFVFTVTEFMRAALQAKGSLVLALVPREILWRVAVIGLALVAAPPLTAPAALGWTAGLLAGVTIPQAVSLIRELRRHRGHPLPAADLEAMRKAKWGYWGGTSITPIIANVTTLIVGVAFGPAAAGAFFAADRLAKLSAVPLMVINQIVGPALGRSFQGGRLEEVRFITGAASLGSLVIGVGAFVGYLFFGRFALRLFDPDYPEAYPLLLILAAAQMVNTACGPNFLLLNMAGRERQNLIIMAVWGAITLGAVSLGAVWWGGLGVALASGATTIGCSLTALVVCRATLHIRGYATPDLIQSPRNRPEA